MSLARSRHADVLQHIMNSFSQFEKKLDKLQDDVSNHGQTLTELRVLVKNLSMNTMTSPDRRNDIKYSAKKTFAGQHDIHAHLEETQKPKKKNADQSLPGKMRSKNYQGQKNINDGGTIRTYPSSPRTMTIKRSPRPRKAEAPRKATTLRPQKVFDKKRNKKMPA